uniref:MOG interacting and ectopic P-granules protein 1 n=1 Tax=Xenopsylla cheopis TaxID=163159 RepID=A0A6M2DZZ3_XENCH
MAAAKQSFSVLPVAVPAQGMYPPNIRGATITPVNNTTVHKVVPTLAPVLPNPSLVLPNLTDDMFVVEAPSFIVPYVYEKPPSEPFRQFVDKMGKEVEEARKLVEEQEKEEEAKEATEKENSNENVEKKQSDSPEKTEIKKKSKKNKQKKGDEDDSWDENDTSDTEDDDDVDGEKIQKEVLVKDIKEDSLEAIKKHIITPESVATVKPVDKKSDNYFENPIGKFFMNIGINLVQEYVQTDLLKQQKRKRDRENKTQTNSTATQMAINSLIKNLEFSKENNEPYHFEQKRCEMCNFKTESALALAHHMETPHMRNYFYRCNFCPYEIRSPHDILIHMEVEHKTKGRLERAASYHQCPNCPFEDNGKAKLARHQLACARKFKPEINLGPPMDWEPPAKIPRTSRPKQSLTSAASAYQQAMANQARIQPALPKLAPGSRGRGRPALNKTNAVATGTAMIRGNMMYRTNMQNNQLLLPNNYPYNTSQLMQTSPSSSKTPNNSKALHQPSISITPLPRQSTSTASTGNNSQNSNANKPGQQTSGKAAFVICEICDGYIKDLDQLRNHMQWIHKVKIHPKMIYNRPPLNCQKCQFRFFTDQGLERHLLGSHGLVTSSMQEAANKGKDAGRCPVCGRVYQWKLLNHVNRDHNMTLKPAHLSYKCTVCTATFGMYKQFENHVYSAHSVVAKKVMDKKAPPSTSNSSSSSSSTSSSTLNKTGDSLLKPLKINDEITIIPQPPKPRPAPAGRTTANSSATLTVTKK